MEITVETPDSSLYHRYPKETQAQPCFVELDVRTGKLRAAYDPVIGSGATRAVAHGFCQRWRIPALKAHVAAKLLAEIAAIAPRIVAGYTTHWDGERIVARFSVDAIDAVDEIENLCDHADDDPAARVAVWTASEFFGPLGTEAMQARELGITSETTDEEIATIAARETANAADNGIDEIEGAETYLRQLRGAEQAA